MSEQTDEPLFDESRAKHYEDRFAKLAPLRHALQLVANVSLSNLPEDARVLLVGAGTGAELVPLAELHPGWRFVAVDPAPAMLAQARAHAERVGIHDRVTFHEGYLDSLPAQAPFDAATSILVSQFVVEPEARRSFFGEIASRLKPQAPLVSADLAGEVGAPEFEAVYDVWKDALRYTGFDEDAVAGYRKIFGDKVAVVHPDEVSRTIEAGGFTRPTLLFQGILMHAWRATRA